MSDESWLVGIDVYSLLDWPEMKDVNDELSNPRLANRTHGSRATYALGCRGPLCSIAERDRARRRNELRAHRQNREYRAGGTKGRTYDRDDLLLALIVWHKKEIALNRIARAS